MRYEFAKIDGLSTLFTNKQNMESGIFNSEVSNELDSNTTIYVTCIDGDDALFGTEFVTGSTWVLTHGMIVGDKGGESVLTNYIKGSDTSLIENTDTISQALAKLENRIDQGSGQTYYEGDNILIDASNNISAIGYTYNDTSLTFVQGIGTEAKNEGIGEHAEGRYNKSNKTSRNHEGFVDLGLPSGNLWGTCNIGSSTETGYGNFYAWGEITPKSNYDLNTYRFGDKSPFTKYDTDGKVILEPSDDIASITYGQGYRIPLMVDFQELFRTENVDRQWDSSYQGSGVSGYKFINKSDPTKYIFLPVGGCMVGDEKRGDESGLYWCSDIDKRNHHESKDMVFSSNVILYSTAGRGYGCVVRPIFSSRTIYSVGVGSDDSNRKNAIEVFDNGDVYINGVGGYDGTNPESSDSLQKSLEPHDLPTVSLAFSHIESSMDDERGALYNKLLFKLTGGTISDDLYILIGRSKKFDRVSPETFEKMKAISYYCGGAEDIQVGNIEYHDIIPLKVSNIEDVKLNEWNSTGYDTKDVMLRGFRWNSIISKYPDFDFDTLVNMFYDGIEVSDKIKHEQNRLKIVGGYKGNAYSHTYYMTIAKCDIHTSSDHHNITIKEIGNTIPFNIKMFLTKHENVTCIKFNGNIGEVTKIRTAY
jgi:hypothetical protein